MSVKNFSTTPASNATVDSINFAESQAPSSVNDSARQLMADMAELFALNKGGMTTGTVGGTGETMTLATTPNPFQAAYAAGQHFLVKAPGANTSSAPTINVAALGAKTIKANGQSLPIPAYLTNEMLLLAYDGTDMQLLSVMRESYSRNAQTGTTYTVVEADRGKHVTLSNASTIAVTLPQSTSSAFVSGWYAVFENIGAGTVTITPTTSTINGGASIKLGTGEAVLVTADGTNYRALGQGAAYTNINGLTEDTTQLGTDFVATANVAGTIAKKVKLQAVHSPSASAKTGSYTVVDADRGTSIRFAGLAADATLTLPAASGRAGFLLYVSNEDTTDAAPFGVIVDPNSAELIDGFSTRKGYMGTRVTLICDGTGWRTVQGYWRYFSGDQTITGGGSLTLAHGLGVRPKRCWGEFKCTTAELNYSVGDIIAYFDLDVGSVNNGVVMIMDATNVGIRFGSSGTMSGLNKTTGAGVNLTNASWRLRVYAED